MYLKRVGNLRPLLNQVCYVEKGGVKRSQSPDESREYTLEGSSSNKAAVRATGSHHRTIPIQVHQCELGRAHEKAMIVRAVQNWAGRIGIAVLRKYTPGRRFEALGEHFRVERSGNTVIRITRIRRM